jgi:hypothetical protein
MVRRHCGQAALYRGAAPLYLAAMSINEYAAEIAQTRPYRVAVWLMRLCYLTGLTWIVLLRGLSQTALWRAGVRFEARPRLGWAIADGSTRRQFRRDVFWPHRR